MIYPPTTIHELAARINQFITTYGGKPVKSNSSRSLDVISDFLCVLGAELSFNIRRHDEPGTNLPLTPNPDAPNTEGK